jgi:hypothetical protein
LTASNLPQIVSAGHTAGVRCVMSSLRRRRA